MGVVWMAGPHTSEMFPSLQEQLCQIGGALETSNRLRSSYDINSQN